MSRNPFAIVFPGQGSQSVGMLADLACEHPAITKLFRQASSLLDYDLWALVSAGPKEKLNQTEFTQPALLTADLAVYHCWREMGGPRPAIVAGHSLGEYSALVCGGVLSFDDALHLVAKRGHYMQQAVPASIGAMAAIIGLEDQIIEEICEIAKEDEVVSPANYNAIGQVVVAGHTGAITRVISLAKDRGAKLAKRISVSVPSHCQLMQPAAEQLTLDLKNTTFSSPEISIVQNVDVATHVNANKIRSALVKQLVAPVRWVETIQHMASLNMTHIVECGPGKVLSGLIKRIDRGIQVSSTDTLNNFSYALENIKEVMTHE